MIKIVMGNGELWHVCSMLSAVVVVKVGSDDSETGE